MGGVALRVPAPIGPASHRVLKLPKIAQELTSALRSANHVRWRVANSVIVGAHPGLPLLLVGSDHDIHRPVDLDQLQGCGSALGCE